VGLPLVEFSCGSRSIVRARVSFLCHMLNGLCIGLTYNQLNNNLTSQAATMSTHGLPNDVLSNLDPLALIIFIPIFDIIVRRFVVGFFYSLY
jgi:dipeptide/tripeptide permease